MINITLILLLLHFINLVIFKPKMNAFNCGIFGYNGNNFNKYKFNILGLYNDSRGGDSCGVFLKSFKDTQISYGIDKTKLFKSFIEEGNGIMPSPRIALGHCRKASVGGISLATAQPVVIRHEDGRVLFTMIHNGTLINYKELANKYNIEYNFNESDSQIFARIIWNAGYQVLGEYDGGGAFVFWDSRDGLNTIKVFKGASLYYQNDDLLYIERPLFSMHKSGSYWFSSMYESLNFINDSVSNKIEEVKTNVLITIHDGNIIGEDKIDRSTRKQSENLVYKYIKPATTIYGHYNYDNELGYGMDDWDGVDNTDWYNNKKNNQKEKNFEEEKRFEKPAFLTGYKCNKIIVKNFIRDKIYFDRDGLYKINDEVCHGIIQSTIAGFIGDHILIEKNDYYFVCGIMMKSYFDYLCALEYILREYQNDLYRVCVIYLSKFSVHETPLTYDNPVTKEDGISMYRSDGKNDAIESNKKLSPYFTFSRDEYTLTDGFITYYANYSGKREYIQDKISIQLDKKILDKTIIGPDLQELIEEQL